MAGVVQGAVSLGGSLFLMRTHRLIGVQPDFKTRPMESTVTVTEAVRGFSGLIDRVVHRGEVAILTRNGKPVARITPERVRRTTGRELAEFWRNRIPMSLGEADSFAKDLAEIRSSGNRPQRDPWME